MTEKTKIKTIRLKMTVIDDLEKMAMKENRNFNNMVETLLMKATSQQQAI